MIQIEFCIDEKVAAATFDKLGFKTHVAPDRRFVGRKIKGGIYVVNPVNGRFIDIKEAYTALLLHRVDKAPMPSTTDCIAILESIPLTHKHHVN